MSWTALLGVLPLWAWLAWVWKRPRQYQPGIAVLLLAVWALWMWITTLLWPA